MFKQLAFVCLLILVATAKKHRDEPEAGNDDEELKCLMDNCQEQVGACIADDACFETIDKCSAGIPEGSVPTEEQITEFAQCLQEDQPAFDIIDCAITNCSQDAPELKLNKHQRKSLHKAMKRMQ